MSLGNEHKKNNFLYAAFLVLMHVGIILSFTAVFPACTLEEDIKTLWVEVIKDNFVAVTEITEAPASTTEGSVLTLKGVVSPTNATSRVIVWSVSDAGTTGAVITGGNKLKTTAAGIVTVSATITNGQAIGTPFIQNFNITVGLKSVVVTYNSGNASGASGALFTESAGYGSSFTLSTDYEQFTRPGYTYSGWTTSRSGDGTRITTLTNITANITVYPYWESGPVYTIMYAGGNANGVSGISFSENAGHGSNVALSTDYTRFTRGGYTYSGWTISQGGGGTKITTLNNIQTSMTLYPYWEAIPTFTITYAPGTNGTGTQFTSTGYEQGSDVTLSGDYRFTRTNYVQDGWTITSSGGGSKITLLGNIQANTTVYPYWVRTYTVTANWESGSIGTITGGSQTVKNGENSANITFDSGEGFHITNITGEYTLVSGTVNAANGTRSVIVRVDNVTSNRTLTAARAADPAPGSLAPQDLNYTENPSDIPNPDRGFHIPNEDCVVPVSGSSSAKQLAGLSTGIGNNSVRIEARISHVGFDLRNFSSDAYLDGSGSSTGMSQALTDTALAYVRGTLENVRKGEGVAIVRFNYDGGGYNYNGKSSSVQQIGPEPKGGISADMLNELRAEWGWSQSVTPPADMQWILYHIFQLKPILQEYEDVIMAVDAGFFGSWGEMHTSVIATTAQNYAWLFDALLNAVPSSRPILGHAGGFLAWYNARYGSNGTIQRGTSYTFSNIDTMPVPERGSAAARFGMFNDSYSTSNNDSGSLSEGISYIGGSFSRNRVIAWIRKQNNFYGGETSTLSTDDSYTRFPFAAWEAPIAHTSHLNANYYTGILNSWASFQYAKSAVEIPLSNSYSVSGLTGSGGAIYDAVYNGKNGGEFIRDRLGYRLVLREASMSNTITRNDTLVFQGKIQNVGWGNIVNRKNVYVILKPKSGSGSSYNALTNLDARDWLSDTDGRADNTAAWRDLNFSVNIGSFGSVAAGEYNVFLKIVDPVETTSNKRSIQFANNPPNGVSIWDSTLGANLIGSTIITN